MIRQSYKTVSEACELPKILQLGNNLYAASFFLMKLLPARFILDLAAASGQIRRGSQIIESSSGTFALALAILCAERGYRLRIIGDPAIDLQLKRRLEDLGTCVEIVTEPALRGGYQRARLDVLAKFLGEDPTIFYPSQYSNPDNPGGYAPVAGLLGETVGRIDCLVGAVGSGGSICGTTTFLRRPFPKLRVVGVDTYNSVLFGMADGPRLLHGLGNSLLPKNLDHTLFDEVHWVSARAAFAVTRKLHRDRAVFVGPTSGASYLVARWWAEQNPNQNVVCLFPDEGYRYADTVYKDEWLKANGVWFQGLLSEPIRVNHPREARPDWAYLAWNRRSYEDVVGKPSSSSAFIRETLPNCFDRSRSSRSQHTCEGV